MASRIFKQQTLHKVVHDGTLEGEGTPQIPLAVVGMPNASITLSMLASDVYDSAVVELGGDFTAGAEVKCVRIGDMVTISGVGVLNHASDATPTSSAGVIPAAFRPIGGAARNAYNASNLRDMQVTTTGTLFLIYDSAGTSSGVLPSITYNV